MTELFKGSETPISLDDIRSFEGRLGITLPADYRAFLLRSNGGRCLADAAFFSQEDGRELSAVDRFLGLSSVSYESLEGNYLDVGDLLPPGVLPVAYDGGGNYLLLDCAPGLTCGAVYFSTLETLNQIDQPARADLILVSNTFDDLLRQIGLLR